jgi:hypothetical protein
MRNRIIAAVLAAAVMTTLALPTGAAASGPNKCYPASWVTYKTVPIPSGYAVYQKLVNNCGVWGYRTLIERMG